MLHNIRTILFISLAILVFLVTSAHAQLRTIPRPEGENLSSPQSEIKNWKFEIGGGVMYGPKYEGSDNFEFQALPQLAVEYKNGLFFANLWDGIGSYLLQGENYKVGVSIGFSLGREEDDDEDNLRGMGDIDMGLTFNLLGEYSIGPVQISGKVIKGTEDYGTTATLEIGTMFSVTDQLMVMVSVGPTWADADHMNTYFGVSSGQSARSGYKRYEPDCGVKSVGFTFGAFYNFTEHWEAVFMLKGDQLIGDAADSPITKNDFNPSVFITLGYSF